MMNKLNINCNKCKHCTGNECVKYGDDADVAVKRCAEDSFTNYDIEDSKELEARKNVEMGN